MSPCEDDPPVNTPSDVPVGGTPDARDSFHMPMSHRTTTRSILMTALLGLSLGACSFSYSSGSSSSPNRASSGKPVHHNSSSSSGKVDNRGKSIPRGGSTGSGKSVTKADPTPTPTAPPERADTSDDPPQRTKPAVAPPKRTKVPPKRTKVPPQRTPTTGDEPTEIEPNTDPAASDTIKAKTKSDNPSASGRLVAPQ